VAIQQLCHQNRYQSHPAEWLFLLIIISIKVLFPIEELGGFFAAGLVKTIVKSGDRNVIKKSADWVLAHFNGSTFPIFADYSRPKETECYFYSCR